METSNSIVTTGTATPANSTEGSALARLAALPARLDDETLGKVEAYARSAPPALPKTDETQIAQFCRMMTDMPRQTGDAVAGVIKVENMVRHLGHLPRAALNWMMGEVHARFTFHPSIKELLDLAAQWSRSDEAVKARAKAEVMARRERQARLDDARNALRDGTMPQAAIDALPERFKVILETEALLRLEGEGYAARPQHNGEIQQITDMAGLQAAMAAKFQTERSKAQ